MRGNHVAELHDGYDPGSIPACAGEPSFVLIVPGLSEVYPRVCGGTTLGLMELVGDDGLSPRVRGNPRGDFVCAAVLRSIPACAGEPSRSTTTSESGWVYPRVCGGTVPAGSEPLYLAGLSPRVRGNRVKVWG